MQVALPFGPDRPKLQSNLFANTEVPWSFSFGGVFDYTAEEIQANRLPPGLWLVKLDIDQTGKLDEDEFVGQIDS